MKTRRYLLRHLSVHLPFFLSFLSKAMYHKLILKTLQRSENYALAQPFCPDDGKPGGIFNYNFQDYSKI
ncbi:MAG: hypothetical protein WCK09_16720 [Bacteroidota bacterium]